MSRYQKLYKTRAKLSSFHTNSKDFQEGNKGSKDTNALLGNGGKILMETKQKIKQ